MSSHGGEPAASGVDGPPPEAVASAPVEDRLGWLDATRNTIYELLWRGAMRGDSWFGTGDAESEYRKVVGSIAPAILWDDHYGMSFPLRFNVLLPLPQFDERLHAFLGRVDPNEYVSESEEPSGAFRRQYGPVTQDQTILGLAFNPAVRGGGGFDAGAGMRVALPLDPYVKGSYSLVRGSSVDGRLLVRETAFWERDQGVGVTTRADLERIYQLRWMARWTGSATLSQRSQGVLGWSAVDVMRGYPGRRAVALELEVDGQTQAAVPLHSYGCKLAYRQSVLRKWLILEVRSSLAWPKDLPQQERRISPGVGLGFEMLLGTEVFLARPVTF